LNDSNVSAVEIKSSKKIVINFSSYSCTKP